MVIYRLEAWIIKKKRKSVCKFRDVLMEKDRHNKVEWIKKLRMTVYCKNMSLMKMFKTRKMKHGLDVLSEVTSATNYERKVEERIRRKIGVRMLSDIKEETSYQHMKEKSQDRVKWRRSRSYLSDDRQIHKIGEFV